MSGDDGKKKRVSLPVLGQAKRASTLGEVDTGDGVPTARAPAAWILLGALASFAVTMPLVFIVVAVLGAVYRAPIGAPQTVAGVAIAGVLVVFAGAFSGGYIVGRFGGRAGPREGALAGLLVGAVLWVMSRMVLGFPIVLVTLPAGYLGARIGKRSRKPGDSIGA